MGKGDTTQTTVQKPLREQYDALRPAWLAAQKLYEQPTTMYGGNFTAERDPLSYQANDLTQGLMNSDYVNSARAYLGKVLGGDFMKGPGENPALDSLFSSISSKVGEDYQRYTAPGTASRFAGQGGAGGSAFENATRTNERSLAEGLGRVGSDIYYQDYNNRLNQMDRALSMVPGIRNVDYADIGQFRTQGAINESYDQARINESVARHDFAQNEPKQRLDELMRRITTPSGVGTSTTTTQGANTIGASLGTGALGLVSTVLGTMLGGPAGAAMGMGLGGAGGKGATASIPTTITGPWANAAPSFTPLQTAVQTPWR